MEYLDQHKIGYETADVRSNPAMMKRLQEISGQQKTPTLDWEGKVLADFGVDQLEEFLRDSFSEFAKSERRPYVNDV